MPVIPIQLAGHSIFISLIQIKDRSIDSLSENELEIYSSFKLEKRKKEWMAGREAAKEAVRKFLLPYTPEGLEILTKPGGEPFVKINGKSQNDIRVSISHSNEVAIAAVGRKPIVGLGIDAEVVEERPSSFLRTAFTPAERRIFQKPSGDHTALISTSLYTMKEAVTKALGIGLSVNTYDVELLVRDGENTGLAVPGENSIQSREDRWKVVLHNEAKVRLHKLGGCRIIVKSQGLDDIFEMVNKENFTSKKYAVGLAMVL
ncbi:MAG: 4'-phosphopantetheinyl transferase superfamily protein [Candidatus Thermoplasmatota archaeon]|jgi:4'-phosphopantetheinyl transferase|nr:4'-phosphopantetheinyl transferase superfamily protein [Candidatus Thermoplasmatota archaeon]MDP7265450.1 4'-phosphopantetheinyl transferase superfamily protein [Candidatus Thermoplasmatota archaeon]